jgi:2-oxo-4-hydroxy-4-carboxy--5-ureidoimidazoline (OHCU) decarboxylase
MDELAKYWTLIRINPAGGYRAEKLAIAQTYFAQNLNDLNEPRRIEQFLIQAYQSGSVEAELCLRCFISHCTIQECMSLVHQFGQYYQFNEFDVLTYVLDDDGSPIRSYVPLSRKILESFNPAIATLNTWATRLVRQNQELNQFFKQQGLFLMSDWAILNNVQPKRLQKVLKERFYWSADAIQTALLHLESYHAVYLSDRLEAGNQGRCKEPTAEQLKRMATYLNAKTNQTFGPNQVQKQLLAIAECVRQHRLNRHQTESIEDQTTQGKAERQQLSNSSADELDQAMDEFLLRYRMQFIKCLSASIESVVENYAGRLQNQKAEQFRTALHLLYCKRITMTQIAEQLDLKRQDNVARLLKLKTLRTDIGLHMLQELKQDISEITQTFAKPEQLAQFAETIDAALRDQIDALLEKDAQQAKTPKAYQRDNLFAEQLCALLHRP